MSKYTGPRVRIIRRLGNIHTFTNKLSENYPSSKNSANRTKQNPFACRLIEKQKLRFYYGLSEKKLIRYIIAARAMKIPTQKALIQKLERRLDCVVYRLGWARTLPIARQIVAHGHVCVDGKPVTIPSCDCPDGAALSMRHSYKPEITNKETYRSSYRSSERSAAPSIVNNLLVIEYYSNRVLNFLLVNHYIFQN
jgi:small subunit ribosomal protein S4